MEEFKINHDSNVGEQQKQQQKFLELLLNKISKERQIYSLQIWSPIQLAYSYIIWMVERHFQLITEDTNRSLKGIVRSGMTRRKFVYY